MSINVFLRYWENKYPFWVWLMFGGLCHKTILYFVQNYVLKQVHLGSLEQAIGTTISEAQLTEKQQQQARQQRVSLIVRRDKLQFFSKNFKVQYMQEEKFTEILTEQCVLNVFEQCVELVDEEQLNRNYMTNRRARRTVFSKILINTEVSHTVRRDSLQSSHSQQKSFAFSWMQPISSSDFQLKSKLQSHLPLTYPQALSFSETYYRFVCTFEQEFKYLIEKTQKDFAAFLNVDFARITQSIDYHISKDNNQYFKQKIQEWISSIRQMLKHKLVKYSQTIDPDRIRDILNYQINYLRQKRTKLLQTIHKLGISNQQQLDALPTLLATILQDAVYSKFDIQQQQMTVDFMHLSKNKQLQALVDEFQALTENIVREMYEEVNKDQILNQGQHF